MSQRARVLWIIALAVLPLAGLNAFLVAQHYEERRQIVADERVGLVQAAAFSVQMFVDHHVASAQVIALHPAVARARSSPDLDAFLHRVAREKPDWAGIGVVGPDGTSITGSRGGPRVFIGDRPYFKHALESGKATVSDGVIGRLTGKPTIVIAVPFELAEGGRGVVAAPLPIEAFSSELLSRLGHRSLQVALLDGQGRLILHNLGAQATVLQEMRSAPGADAALRGQAGSTLATFQEEASLVAYAPVSPYGWAVLLSEPQSSAFASARNELVENLTVLFATLAVVVALGWILGGRLSTLYERVERAVRTRDEFLAAASHDLRNPLAAMSGAADLLRLSLQRSGSVAPERLASCLAHIDSAARRMAHLIDGLLDLARLQMGSPLELVIQTVDLAELVRQIAQEASVASTRHRISLELPERLSVQADAPRLQRAVGNLLANAVKYSPQGGEIRVRLQRSGDERQAVLTIADPGIGIPPQDLERIFERFQRGSNVVGSIPGTGIGLAGARQIIEQHGGSIAATSRVGAGATFTVRLPAQGGLQRDPVQQKKAA
jgi:signal transduction histidine kinase